MSAAEDLPPCPAFVDRCDCDRWHSKHRWHCATNYSEGVGTGAGEGATGQDTGTAWVTRSTDCPEAPAQARPLGPDVGEHDPRCYQRTGVPDDMPTNLCDCRVLRMVDAEVER